MAIVIHEQVFGAYQLGVWEIEEPLQYFLDRVTLSDAEQLTTDGMRENRLLEWLATRYLLKFMIDPGAFLDMATLPTGKPYLAGRDEEISLSHSGVYAAVMMGPQDVGVDIQICKDKITHLEHKFARPEESACIDRTNAVQHLHLLWGAKEVLYKIYARKQLDFITQLFVELPNTIESTGNFLGRIVAGNDNITCRLEYHIINNYVLVYGHRSAP
jgi:hypothetical protein